MCEDCKPAPNSNKVTLKLEIVVDDDLVGPEGALRLEQLRYLFAHAFAEFQRPRRDAEAYVAKRYPESEGYKWLDRGKKTREVETRVKLAEMLRNAGLQAEITAEPCCPDCGATGNPRSGSECRTCEDAYQEMMRAADARFGSV